MAPIRLRSLWRNIHLWLGLSLFVVLAPLGLTGSLLVFDDDLDKLMHPVRYAASAAPALAPSAYIDAARGAFGPRAIPAQLRMPREPGLPVMVIGQAPGAPKPGQRPTQFTAWLDPASGKVLDVGNPRAELRGWIHQLHGNLFMAQPGRKVVGWLGWAMLIMSVTGLCIWWPRGNPLKGLRWRRNPSQLSNLHHMVGFWICVPLAVLSFSGAWIAFPDLARMVNPSAPAPRGPGGPPVAAAPLAQPKTGADAALAAALAQADDQPKLQQLTLPTEGDRPAWRVQLKGDGAPVQVRVDDRSGKAKTQKGEGRQQQSGGEARDPLSRTIRNLHSGEGTGPIWQAIIVIAGITPTILGVTGTILWFVRRRPATKAA